MPADGPGYLRIATEEAFAPPELLAAWREMLDGGAACDPGFRSLWGFYLNSDSERATALRERLQDLGPRRLADMDATGIDREIISVTAPGTQIFDAVRDEVTARDRLPLGPAEKKAFFRSNAERVFRL
jgi:5-carboxyvanillate decarboxylase